VVCNWGLHRHSRPIHHQRHSHTNHTAPVTPRSLFVFLEILDWLKIPTSEGYHYWSIDWWVIMLVVASRRIRL
jgi:hypothetical protein